MLVLAQHQKRQPLLRPGDSLREGAIASTVAHDSHPLIAIGNEVAEMAHAAKVLAAQGGGMVAVRRGEILANLPLPVAGLMTGGDPEQTAAKNGAAAGGKGLGLHFAIPFYDPVLSRFAGIPRLKITDRGLVDVEEFALPRCF